MRNPAFSATDLGDAGFPRPQVRADLAQPDAGGSVLGQELGSPGAPRSRTIYQTLA